MKNILLIVDIENIVKIYRRIFIIFVMKALSETELRAYLEAEKQEIINEYREFNEETIRMFIKEGKAERFHGKWFDN